MSRQILALRLSEGTVLIGAVADTDAAGKSRRSKAPFLAQLRMILAQNVDSQRLRNAALAWGVNSVGLRQQSEVELREQILALVDRGRLVARFLPKFHGDQDAPDIVAGLLSSEPLAADLTKTALSLRAIAFLKLIPAHLAPQLRSDFLRFFDNRRISQIAIVIRLRVGLGLARASKIKMSFTELAREGFGEFGEQLDLIDELAHRLTIATRAEEINETAREVALLLGRLKWDRFTAAMNKLQFVRTATPSGSPSAASPPRPMLRVPPPQRIMLRTAPVEIEKDFADELGQKATLLAAAKNGTPFCEICSA
jgi:hypothetical protein